MTQSDAAAVTRSPKRVQQSRAPGWRLPAGAVSVARPSRWGNPFRMRPVACTEHGRCWTVSDEDPTLDSLTVLHLSDVTAAAKVAVGLFALHAGPMGRYEYGSETLAAMRQRLAGRDLACWCPPGQSCHADVLLEWANSDG